jgi:divalent anion:Na+ symporter, DASS family
MPKSEERISVTSTITSPLLLRLKADRLFSGVADSLFARLLGSVEEVSLAAGEPLYNYGDPAANLYLLEEGTVQLVTPSGRTVELKEQRCGEEAVVMTGYTCTATARTAVRALRIPREALAEVAKGKASFGSEATQSLLSRIGEEQIELPVKAKAAKKSTVSLAEMIGWILLIILPPALFFFCKTEGFTTQASLFSAILTATVIMWVFTLVDEFIPPLVAVVAALFIGLAPAPVALAGFSSPGMMTLIGVFALSASIGSSGLSYRFMLWLLYKLPDRPVYQQSAMLMGGYLLSPITPSGNSRLSLLIPLFRDMMEGLKLPKGGKAATALMAATFSGAMLFSPMLSTSKSSNITAVNLMPVQIQEQFLGLYWLVAALVAAVGITLFHLGASRWLFSSEQQTPLPKDRILVQLQLLGPMTGEERIALGGFVFFLLACGSVSWHHIQPAWIAGCVLIGLLVSGALGKKAFRDQLDWPMVFFLLGMDGITRILDHLGLDTVLAKVMTGWFGFVGGRIDLFILAALGTTLLVRLALPITSGMLVSAIILMPVAEAQGIHPWICIFMTAMFSDIWFRPYQSSQYTQVLSQGLGPQYDIPGFMRYNQIMNFSRVVVAFLSIPYWKWLGLL